MSMLAAGQSHGECAVGGASALGSKRLRAYQLHCSACLAEAPTRFQPLDAAALKLNRRAVAAALLFWLPAQGFPRILVAGTATLDDGSASMEEDDDPLPASYTDAQREDSVTAIPSKRLRIEQQDTAAASEPQGLRPRSTPRSMGRFILAHLHRQGSDDTELEADGAQGEHVGGSALLELMRLCDDGEFLQEEFHFEEADLQILKDPFGDTGYVTAPLSPNGSFKI